MDKKLRFILVFLGSGIAMFLIFYFYPAEIFDMEVSGSLATENVEVSMKTFLGIDETFKNEMEAAGLSVDRKLSGWMILLIITLGMPLMFAYRSNVSKRQEKEEE